MTFWKRENEKTTRRDFVRRLAVGTYAVAVAGSMNACNDTPAPMDTAEGQKYANYFHQIKYGKGQGGPGSADSMFRMNGKDLNDRNTNFSFGYYSKPGSYGDEALVHPYDTCLAFVGLDPEKPDYLGAEIEISLGENFEKYTFDVPSIVCVPKDLPFGPIVAKDVQTPYAHYEIGLAGEYSAKEMPVPANSANSREHAELIKKLSDSAMGDVTKATGPGNAFWIAWPRARKLEDFNVNFSWGFYDGLGNWHREGFDPHVHVGDEFLVFVGLDPARPQYLGAEIDLYMGSEQELHTFDTPMVAVCPSMFVHAPIITKKVDDTFAFFLIRRDKGQMTKEKTPEGYPIQ
jgi:hypothetical protein